VSGNRLYYGDNLDVLRRHVADDSVALVYLDPPFQSARNYNALFVGQDGRRSPAQIKAFEDTWRWDEAAVRDYTDVVERGGRPAEALTGMRTILGENDMLAYLSMMAPRLIELRRVMRDKASIYLHCDPTASHYLKILMDAVFGPANFLNEIVWYYRGAGVPKTARARRHDILLWYAKSAGDHFFNPDPIRRPYAEATRERFKHKIGNVRGERDYGQQELNPKGKHPDDVITHIQPIAPSAKARLGYPTQKPDELLEELIASTTREWGVVLDPFCGCGTTVVAAERLGRPWLGIDVTHLAVNLIKHRLETGFGYTVDYSVVGEPEDLPGAEALAEQDRHQFELWALGLVKARPAEGRKGPDRGIDGRLFFHDEGAGGESKQVVFSVKSGKTGVAHVRDLRGVVERERAQIAVLITLQEPTRPMRTEAASAGLYHSPWGEHPRIQILTVEELLRGARVDMPPVGPGMTLREAPRRAAAAEAPSLFDQGG
jgi:site-specific DNA-methyltransferase (adenine-specific)